MFFLIALGLWGRQSIFLVKFYDKRNYPFKIVFKLKVVDEESDMIEDLIGMLIAHNRTYAMFFVLFFVEHNNDYCRLSSTMLFIS